ncbi:MAG: ferrous iron transport protein B, partial [Lentisphaeria bacterium]
EWTTPHGIIEMLFEYLADIVEASSLGEMTKSLLVNGIINGVGGVLGFTPLIFFIFMFVAILEDSGYVARIAFILDRLLRWFGLEGKSILALIVSGGFGAGCAVPGIMATRTLRDEKDRLVTILVAPMMNCGAKMPVYAMLVGAFFADGQAEMMILIWALSWTIALCSAFCLRKFVVKGLSTPFIMELPIYHLPTIKGVMLHTWSRTWDYVKKAGTILLAMSIVLWALMAFPRANGDHFEQLPQEEQMKFQLEQSFAGRVGTSLEPISKFAGFDWRDNIALVGGFAAKEVVVQTLGTAYSMGEVDPEEAGGLKEKLSAEWTKTSGGKRKALAFIIFVMIYAPCVATLAVIFKETKSWKWTVFASFYTTTLAFILATLVYQIGGLLS